MLNKKTKTIIGIGLVLGVGYVLAVRLIMRNMSFAGNPNKFFQPENSKSSILYTSKTDNR